MGIMGRPFLITHMIPISPIILIFHFNHLAHIICRDSPVGRVPLFSH